jgi:hypothetical protein
MWKKYMEGHSSKKIAGENERNGEAEGRNAEKGNLIK